MKHIGRSIHRFKDNPLEKIYADLWQEYCTRGRTLDYLLAEKINHPNSEVTERDAEVAATVVQWLGSHVGQSFVREALKKFGYEVRKEDVKSRSSKKRYFRILR